MSIDFKRPVRTRDGRDVVIYTVAAGGIYTIHGAVWQEDFKEWHLRSWTLAGTALADGGSSLDLFNIPQRNSATLHVNWYRNTDGYLVPSAYTTGEKAETMRGVGCLAVTTHHVTFDEGEGLK